MDKTDFEETKRIDREVEVIEHKVRNGLDYNHHKDFIQ